MKDNKKIKIFIPIIIFIGMILLFIIAFTRNNKDDYQDDIKRARGKMNRRKCRSQSGKWKNGKCTLPENEPVKQSGKMNRKKCRSEGGKWKKGKCTFPNRIKKEQPDQIRQQQLEQPKTNARYQLITNENIKTVIEEWMKNPANIEQKYGPINEWDTSSVTDMSKLFKDNYEFNANINEWDTSNVTNMLAMFYNASNFNQPLNKWNVSNVKDMKLMFGCSFEQTGFDFDSQHPSPFNQDISNWDTKSVTDMSGMFQIAQNFNQDISRWNTSNVQNMSNMFRRTAFNPPSLNTTEYQRNGINYIAWDTKNVTDMSNMFQDSEDFGFVNGNIGDSKSNFGRNVISRWNTSNVTNMAHMFKNASKFNSDISEKNVRIGNINYKAWDVSNVVFMPWMFDSTTGFDTQRQQGVSRWNTRNVTCMRCMYQNNGQSGMSMSVGMRQNNNTGGFADKYKPNGYGNQPLWKSCWRPGPYNC